MVDIDIDWEFSADDSVEVGLVGAIEESPMGIAFPSTNRVVA